MMSSPCAGTKAAAMLREDRDPPRSPPHPRPGPCRGKAIWRTFLPRVLLLNKSEWHLAKTLETFYPKFGKSCCISLSEKRSLTYKKCSLNVRLYLYIIRSIQDVSKQVVFDLLAVR